MWTTASKPGYGPALGVPGLAALLPGGPPAYALGGITGPAGARACRQAGAYGVAVFGAVGAPTGPNRPSPGCCTRSGSPAEHARGRLDDRRFGLRRRRAATDLKTLAALGVFGASAVTALTPQNTLGVCGVHPVPAAFVLARVDAVHSDLDVRAVKTGMLGTSDVVTAVAGLAAAGRLPHWSSTP